MKHAMAELERLDRDLAAADPGDLGRLREILAERGRWLAELERALAGDACAREEAAELLARLSAIAERGIRVYRLVMLQRLLVQQRMAVLGQDSAVLRAFAPARDAVAGGMVTTSL
jgi:hypothetical protein